MPFFQLVDELSQNRKIRELLDPTLDGDTAGCVAFTVWAVAGTSCQAAGTDGVVKRADVARILLDPHMGLDAAAYLVRVGLWHEPGHSCTRCPPVKEGTYLYHDWFDIRYDTGEAVRLKNRKLRELKDPKLIAQVWARDCIDPSNPNVGRCRYCRVELKRSDRKSSLKPHIDHVDPTVADGVRNLVLACSDCNSKKGNRTPADAGMTLLPPPRPVAEETRVVSPPRSDDGLVSSPQSDAGLASTGSSREGVLAGRDADASVLAGRGDAGTRTTTGRRASRAAADTSIDGAGSPGKPDAGTDPTETDVSTPRPQRIPADPDQTPIKPDQTENQIDGTVLARARAGARQAGSGQGSGLGRGVGKGHVSGSPAPDPSPESTSRKRGRRRSRGRSRTTRPADTGDPSQEQNIHHHDPVSTPARESTWDAGAAPDVDVPARFGSPWAGWVGPPSPVTETICPTHQVHEPCFQCKNLDEE